MMPMPITMTENSSKLPDGWSRAPTLLDAIRAVESFEDLGARAVLLYGSVADGTARPWSDIDLAVIFDDLGDYSSRWSLRREICHRASSASGHACDAIVTDLAEWDVRSKLPVAIEHEVFKNNLKIAGSLELAGTRDLKEIGRPATIVDDARCDILGCFHHMNQVLLELGRKVSTAEDEACRRAAACGRSAAAILLGIRAYIKLELGTLPKLDKDMGKIAAALDGIPEAEESVLRGLLGVDHRVVDGWVRDGWGGPPLLEGVADELLSETITTSVSICLLAADVYRSHGGEDPFADRMRVIERTLHRLLPCSGNGTCAR